METQHCDVVGCAAFACWVCVDQFDHLGDDWLCQDHYDALLLTDPSQAERYIPLSERDGDVKPGVGERVSTISGA